MTITIRIVYQIINAMGQPAIPFSFPDIDGAKSVSAALTNALGMPFAVVKIEKVFEPAIVPLAANRGGLIS